jgi:membrane protein DedA with SNARE-associated domain/rhodanese-related sulfurtransferase
MRYLVGFLGQHALAAVFFNVLLARSGLPLPVVPTLMTAGAFARHSPVLAAEIVLAGTAATLVADLTMYSLGRLYGQRFLGLLCRVSFSPDFCVRRTTDLYLRAGAWCLPVTKFIPGLSLISVAMAGVIGTPAPFFVLLDGIGASLFIGAMVTLGVIFHDAIASALSTLAELGALGGTLVVGTLIFYILIKLVRRQLFIRQLRMNRITVAELRKLIDNGVELVILDVRPKESRVRDGIIPGAIAAHPEDIDPIVKGYDRDAEIIIYCACPNEASAALAAKHLKDAGFRRIRPLLGGIDAWIDAGHPIESKAPSNALSGDLSGSQDVAAEPC